MTTTSLRAEIKNIINHIYYQSDSGTEIFTQEILKLIEKSIDKLYPENPIDTQYKTGYYNAICKVKQELLK